VSSQALLVKIVNCFVSTSKNSMKYFVNWIKRQEISKRNCYIISQRVIIKAIIIIHWASAFVRTQPHGSHLIQIQPSKVMHRIYLKFGPGRPGLNWIPDFIPCGTLAESGIDLSSHQTRASCDVASACKISIVSSLDTRWQRLDAISQAWQPSLHVTGFRPACKTSCVHLLL